MAKLKSEPRGPLDLSPSHLLHRALQRALDLYAKAAGANAVTHRQFAVLSAAAGAEGLSQTDLVRATGIDRSTLADLVARMIGKGLLERERSSADGRANAVRLTDMGRAALDQAAPKAADADQALLKLLSSGKRNGFLNALRQIAAEPANTTAAKAAHKAKKGGRKAKKSKKKSKKAKAETTVAA
jgi:DNA-binding MarR family transcriptional regulator